MIRLLPCRMCKTNKILHEKKSSHKAKIEKCIRNSTYNNFLWKDFDNIYVFEVYEKYGGGGKKRYQLPVANQCSLFFVSMHCGAEKQTYVH